MGKGEELWDDSALINAFDNAMSSYKKMHSRKSKDNSADVSSASTDQSHAAISDLDEKSNVPSNAAIELGEAKKLTAVQENHHLDSIEPQPGIYSSGGQDALAVNDYSYVQNSEGYNQLLTQYYDIEEKRQRILHQLQQLGGYDYHYPAEGFGSSQQWGTCCSQDHSVPKSQPVICSCCPYACRCSAVPCTSFSACSFDGTCDGKLCNNSSEVMGLAKSVPLVDGDIVKIAMGAAERAISTTKTISSINSGTKEKEKEKENGKGKDNEEKLAQNTRSETDLSIVLNAWYSAGFYTGKYLTEQSIMKK
ncbi:uncharacterized protein LOC8278511 isoform X2 [Ricinus communis]|uniref:uncharacterized protein LOC8278511 isoform X2 n=1 Tax=Ricinus communis TaxID=3988 RepID=UPI00201A748C|nr:uncharacterized protein LOC8278511 isoform X2 [Ricinus communis]